MIDWNLTEEQFGYKDLKQSRPKVVVRCDQCKTTATKTIRRKSEVVNGQIDWLCAKCRNNRPEYKAKLKARWTDEYKTNASESAKAQWTDEYRTHMSEKGKAQWTDEYRERMDTLYQSESWKNKMSEIQNRPDVKKAKSDAAKKQWENPQFREHMIQIMSKNTTELWKNPKYREIITEATRAMTNTPKWRAEQSIRSKKAWEEHREKYESIFKSEEFKEKIRNLQRDPKHKAKMREVWISDEFRNAVKARWENPELRKRMTVVWTTDRRVKMAEKSRKQWQNSEYREHMALIHASSEYREKMAKIRAAQPRVSSLQTTLYSMLDDLNVPYYREYQDGPADDECTIGPYTFDCVVPRKNEPTLLIECQGEYWHQIDSPRDKAKSSYIANNFAGVYELKHLWEHEFLNKNKVEGLLKYWLGISEQELIEYSFDDIKIKKCPAKDYRDLLAKYHYLHSNARGGIIYGAYLEDKLIAVCSFSPPVRQNITVEGYEKNEIRELSRFCIHPKYQKKNLGSWFISRCISALPPKHKCIISYCDTTFNHNGATYKACNFEQDKEIPPDYWYISDDGWVMHKKTLYNHAVKMSMTETAYAEKMGYVKIRGYKKLRFVYRRV